MTGKSRPRPSALPSRSARRRRGTSPWSARRACGVSRFEPARSCRSSTFCVTSSNSPGHSASSRASAWCAAIRLDGSELRPPRVVEGVDQRGIARERLGRRDVLDPVALPQPVGPAEGREAAFGGNSGAGQDDDVANVHDRQHRAACAMSEGKIRIGIGGWTYPPWRGVFYPDKLPQAKELEYASTPARRDRDQRDLLRPAEAEELGSMGESRTRGVPVRGQGLALLRDALEARRSWRGTCRLLRPGIRCARSEARADPLAVRTASEIRPRRHRRLSSTCFPRSSMGSRSAPCDRAAPRKLPRRERSSSFAARATSRSCSRIRTNIPASKRIRRTSATRGLQRMNEDIPTGYDRCRARPSSPSRRASGEGAARTPTSS